ncbi:hypothetical protein NWP22_03080 [Anabaenopsis tanganyikae CS-531]|jgi:hypothetical protein|uniref:Uncharacterized protein n=2 Tax=Anabaenopsis TaxID=110103 RepID=A0ABT6KBY5_9CYAN|nr:MULTISPECIES: hypothetical protein [Anabaenopsis]MDB9539194.1 hypothetical protein [Anabaenopsis arnoldii]MDH6091482.1 hypothetical protein [Anabaenopsis arnoldii]MDH6099836.1 hypothetical protein [Anabaenopsis sp. FSS-46]MDH6104864.1 hypothetical protein [Anabaenopsis tanganyikae CS-531]
MAKNNFYFDSDDSHPMQPTSADIILRQQLEYSISRYFYHGCDRTIQNLLSNCRWYVTTRANAMTLVIECPDQVTNWRVLQKIVPMGTLLHSIISSAKIRVCPPDSQGVPFEMRVDELSVYRDWA